MHALNRYSNCVSHERICKLYILSVWLYLYLCTVYEWWQSYDWILNQFYFIWFDLICIPNQLYQFLGRHMLELQDEISV